MPNVTSKNPTSADYIPKFATASSITNSPIIIDVNDNVGIGKTPAVKLDVDGVIQMTGFNLTSGPAAGYVLTSDAAGKGTWGPPGVGGSGTANFLPKFTSTNAIGNSVISESGGNIGIGTTTPATKLEVNGTVRLGGTVPAPGVYIDGTGNVGIGTASPSQKLDINGNINIVGSVQALQSMLALNGMTGRSSNPATPAGVFDGAPDGKILSGQVGGLEKFSVDASGNVQASGTAQMTGIKLPTGASNGYVLTSDASGNASWLPPSGGGALGGTGTANAVPKFTDPTTIGDSLVYETDGNVGIGTSIPQEEFTLAQDSNIATEMQMPANITYGFQSTGGLPADDYFFILAASDGVGWTKGTAEIQVILGASDHTINLVWGTVVGATNYRVYRALTPGGPYKFIETSATNFDYTDDGLFVVSGTPPTVTTAFVNKTSASGDNWFLGGSIGIGTTKPQARLDVVGDIKLQTGPAIIEFSTDGTLSDESDSVVPTEKAVKDYVDNLLVGSVSAFAMDQPPDGWLECNGQEIDRVQYARLFNKINIKFGAGNGSTTFNLPDLRGEFIRGWDHDRGADVNRLFGSFQNDQIIGHRHFIPAHAHGLPGVVKDTLGAYGAPIVIGPLGVGLTWPGYNGTPTPDSGTHPETLGSPPASLEPSANSIDYGEETRSRNIALMYCIKY